MNQKTYVFDLDNTLCKTKDQDYANAEPIRERIEVVRKLKGEGHTVFIQTARHHKFFQMTKNQLMSWGVLYDGLFTGNLPADYYINDKGLSDKDFFSGDTHG